MPIPSTPSIMPTVLGYAADTVQIPETTPTGQGIPSFRDLFPFITQVDPDAGGVMVERSWMNALFNLLGQHAFFQQSGCVYPWQATLNYIAGSHVRGSDDVEYIALQPSGPDVSGTGAKDPALEANRNYWISLASFVSGGLVPDSRHVIAGTGLTGGGPLSADVTLAAKLTDSVSLADSTTAASAKAVKAVYDRLEALRVSFLGVPRYWRSTTLPAGHVWANGDLALFSDWPELENLYRSGGLEGMLLSYDVPPSTIAQYCGRWRLNASSPTGLYVPNLSERFINSTINTNAFGTANTAGVPNIVGGWEDLHVPIVEVPAPGQSGAIIANGIAFANSSLSTGGTGYVWNGVNFDASRSSAVYGRSPTVMPASVNYPIIIYLGNHS